jgi:hypothetical protein
MSEDSGRQRPDESDADYIRRMGRVSRAREKMIREQQTQDSLDYDAAVERAQRAGRAADDELDDFFRKEVGIDLSELQKQYAKGKLQAAPELQGAIQDIKKAQRVKGVAARNKRVQKAIKKNKPALRKAAKEAKKNKGCAVIAVALLTVGGGTAYGLFEAGHAVVSAMGY